MFFRNQRRVRAGEGVVRSGRDMFPATRRLTFRHPDDGWLLTESGLLGRAGLELWRVRSTGHEIDLAEPSKASLILPLAGRAEVATPSAEHSAGVGQSLLFGPNVRRTRVSGTDGIYDAAVLLVPAASVRRATGPLARGLEALELRLDGEGDRATHALHGYVRYLVGELAHPDSALAAPGPLAGAAAVALDLLADLLEKTAGEDARDAPAAGLEEVLRAEEFMRERHREPLTVAEVSRAVGVGKRSLQIAFRRHRDGTPRQALARIRLEEARRRLAEADADETVTAVALDLGFTHLGRFSGQYRAAFGETPSETLRRGRRGR